MLEKILIPTFSPDLKIHRKWTMDDGNSSSDIKTVNELFNEITYYKGAGARKLEIWIERLPTITILFEENLLTDELIQNTIREMGPPNKITKTFLREILQKNEIHGDIPGGFKKKVRKILEGLYG
jgi:hypothetical protein